MFKFDMSIVLKIDIAFRPIDSKILHCMYFLLPHQYTRRSIVNNRDFNDMFAIIAMLHPFKIW